MSFTWLIGAESVYLLYVWGEQRRDPSSARWNPTSNCISSTTCALVANSNITLQYQRHNSVKGDPRDSMSQEFNVSSPQNIIRPSGGDAKAPYPR